MIDLVLDILRAIVLAGLFVFFLRINKEKLAAPRKGWRWILTGFGLLLFGAILDVTDELDGLSQFVIIGDTDTEAILEKVFGVLGGFVCLTIGFVQWIPSVHRLETEIADRHRAEDQVEEHRRTEAALRESEERLKAFINNVQSLVSLKDLEGRYLLYNEEYLRQFGAPPDIEGKQARDVLPLSVGGPSALHEREVIDTKSQITQERELPNPDGSTIHLATKFPLLDDAGKVTAVGTISTDITERKEMERGLATALNEFSAVMESIDYGVLFMGPDLKARIINKAFQNMWKVSDEFVAKHPTMAELMAYNRYNGVYNVADEDFDDYVEQRVAAVHKGPIPPMEMVRADGKIIRYQCIALPDGGRMLTYFDITELKQMEQALQNAVTEAEGANQAKSEFLAAMSHDLRTPLNAILGFADILKGQYLGPIEDKYIEYAHDIRSSGEHLLSLVNDILDLSAIEAGKQSLVMETLATADVVSECAKIVANQAKSGGIEITTDIPSEITPIYADRRAAKQIFLNLLTNAVKFTPEGGKVTVSASSSNGVTSVTVADTGQGIPKDVIPSLTEPFYQLGRNPYLTEKGWGLGLAITKSLVDLHDGNLTIESEPGQGTTVTVALPNTPESA